MMGTRKTNLAGMATAAMVAAIATLLAGCESSDDSSGDYWSTKSPKAPSQAPAQTQTQTTTQSSSSSAPAHVEEGPAATASEDGVGAEDQVPFGSLSWTYGGFRGSAAAKTSASISGLRASAGSMSYHWSSGGCETLGASSRDDYNSTIACFFVQKEDGRWVGGKFDFISTSRTSRGFENIYGGYGGWTLAGVPNPCPCAFVIVSSNGKKRTNVISGTWHR